MFELLGEWAARWIIRVTTFALIVVTVYAVVENIFHFAGAVYGVDDAGRDAGAGDAAVAASVA